MPAGNVEVVLVVVVQRVLWNYKQQNSNNTVYVVVVQVWCGQSATPADAEIANVRYTQQVHWRHKSPQRGRRRCRHK